MVRILFGGALFLALFDLDPQWAALVACAMAGWIVVDVLLAETRSARDRATAFSRWRRWHG